MKLKNKITLFCSIIVLCFLTLISFQNCGLNTDAGDFIAGSNGITCDVKIYNSSLNDKKAIFNVGDVINFNMKSTPAGSMGQFLIDSQDGVIVNEPIITPAFKQQIFLNSSDIGDYTYLAQIQDSTGKTICQTAARNFKIVDGDVTTPTCVLTVTSGNGQNFTAGDQIQLRVESVPSGLETFISGQNLNTAGAVTDTIQRTAQGVSPSEQFYPTTTIDAGQWKRTAEVKAADGSFITCQPTQVVLNIAGPPVTPPPVTPPPVTPPPNSATGTITTNKTTCNSLGGEMCGVTLSWTTANTMTAQVYETTDNVNYTFISCGAISSSPVSHTQFSGSKTYTYKLFAAPNCNVMQSSQLVAITPLSSVGVTWIYKSEDYCIPGKVCIPR